MAARLGNVLYWIGCILAGLSVLALAFVALLSSMSGSPDWMGGVAIAAIYLVPLALLCYGTGRACRYVLAGS